MGAGLLASCSSSSGSASGRLHHRRRAPGRHLPRARRQVHVHPGGGGRGPAGDWILIAPGDYHETADESDAHTDPSDGDTGGVLITTPDIHLRGMNRSTVIVDGTKAGSSACSSSPAAQNFGAAGPDGKAVGRNGILIWKADDVYVENLTACNFLAGTGSSGNEIWWNGGDGSGTIGLKGYWGNYLTATSTYFSPTGTPDQQEATAARTASSRRNSEGPRDGTSSMPATSTTRACTSVRATSSVT